MAETLEASLDVICNKLQIIVGRAELLENCDQCNMCMRAVREIVNEIRALEAFVRRSQQAP